MRYRIIALGLLSLVTGAVSLTANALTMTTWNMEWLSDKNDRIEGQRNVNDYQALQSVINQIQPDILAFQEVDSPESIAKVLPPDTYHIYMSDRHSKRKSYSSSQQFTGFAVKDALNVIDHADNREISLPKLFSDSGLRYGAYIEVQAPGQPAIHLLNVHLKAGCYRLNHRQGKRCNTLKEQAEKLANWINLRKEQGQHFAVIGDFNRYIRSEGDWFWSQLEKDTGRRNIVSVTQNVDAQCKARRYNKRLKKWNQVVYHNLVDHIVMDAALAKRVTNAEQYQFDYHTVMNFRMTDHCPVSVTLQ